MRSYKKSRKATSMKLKLTTGAKSLSAPTSDLLVETIFEVEIDNMYIKISIISQAIYITI